MTFQILLQTLLNSLMYMSILSLSSFAIILIFRTSTTTNFAQGTISVFGAYIVAYLFTMNHVNVFVGLAIGTVASFLLGFLIDTQIFRRSRHLTGIGKQMITMGLVLFISGLIPVIFGTNPVMIPYLIPVTKSVNFTLFGASYTLNGHALLTTILAIVILTTAFIALKYTKWGLGVRATASSEKVAGMMGVNTRMITAISWSLAGFIGGLAAILYAGTIGSVEQSLMTNVQVNGFLANILGGFGTFYGPIVGSVLITFFGNTIGYFNSVWKDVIVYGLILVVLLVRPFGIFGKKTIKKV